MTASMTIAAARPRLGIGRIRRLVVLLAAGAAVLGMTACQPAIDPNNRPTQVPGQSNGRLTADLLVQVRTGCSVHRDAAPALAQMLDAAARDGVPIRANSCYRDYEGQVAARQHWCDLGRCEMAAVPGTSNHGWGKAVDFAYGTTEFNFESPGYRWMAEHAWVFGWNHPGWAEPDGSSPEAWHWEWVGDGGTLHPGQIVGPQR